MMGPKMNDKVRLYHLVNWERSEGRRVWPLAVLSWLIGCVTGGAVIWYLRTS